MVHRVFGKFYHDPRTGYWWSKDHAHHAHSEWKVFVVVGHRLEWIADADAYGDFIEAKHKSPTGTSISLSEFNSKY